MTKKRGFTLVELLAALVILTIVLSITIPSISGIIKSATKEAFKNNAQQVLQTIANKKLSNRNFNPLEITKDNMESILGLSDSNYSQVNVSINNDNIEIILIGKNEWNGFTAYGSMKTMKVVETEDYDVIPPVITILGDNPVNIYSGSVYTDAGATAVDNVDGDVTNEIIITGIVNPNVVGTYTITYTVTDVAGNNAYKSRTINVLTNIFTFNYTGNYQTFTVPENGIYKIELWGAQGGVNGAYTSGTISLSSGSKLYIYAGSKGSDQCNPYTLCSDPAFNGGGPGGYFTYSPWPNRDSGGGGATDIRLVNGAWDEVNSLRSRIMVAGAGGTGAGGYGGTLTGYTGNAGTAGGAYAGEGGTQTAGGSSSKYPGTFGTGGEGYVSYPDIPNNNDGFGGGGGYYGGGGGYGGIPTSIPGGSQASGGGGSSFISGYPGCNAINSSGVHTGQANHYSGYVFTNSQMIAGNALMPNTSGGTEVGHAGNGFAIITYLP